MNEKVFRKLSFSESVSRYFLLSGCHQDILVFKVIYTSRIQEYGQVVHLQSTGKQAGFVRPGDPRRTAYTWSAPNICSTISWTTHPNCSSH